jgi:hypothetical protein
VPSIMAVRPTSRVKPTSDEWPQIVFAGPHFAGRLRGLLWLFPPPGRQASTPGGGAKRVGVVGAPCPMLRWPGCARRSQEPRPRRVCIINGKASCRLVRFGFGRCWDLFGGARPAGKKNTIYYFVS